MELRKIISDVKLYPPPPKYSARALDTALGFSDLTPAEREAAIILMGVREVLNVAMNVIDR
jgi:hypothetical protein